MVALLTMNAFAQEPEPPPPPPPTIEVSAEASHVGNTGNTETTSTGVGANLTWRFDGWTVEQRGLFSRGRADGRVTAQAFVYRFALNRDLTPRLKAFAEFRFLHDPFAGVEQQSVPFAGLSMSLLESERVSLTVRGAGGLLAEGRGDGDDVRSASIASGSRYRWKLPRGPQLNGDLLIYAQFDRPEDWRLVHAVDLSVDLTSLLAIKAQHNIRYAHDPVIDRAGPPRANVDTTSVISIVVKFAR